MNAPASPKAGGAVEGIEMIPSRMVRTVGIAIFPAGAEDAGPICTCRSRQDLRPRQNEDHGGGDGSAAEM
jgi:hypothetical protein